MRIALFAMPDCASSFDQVMRLPNLGLCSLAVHLPEDDVRIYDLIVTPRGVEARLRSILEEFRPEIVGVSAMSFQFASAARVARIAKAILPGCTVVAGGYHATVMHRSLLEKHDELDFIVRGEGELTFRDLVDRLAGRVPGDFSAAPGLSWRAEGAVRHNPDRELMDLHVLPPPGRSARQLTGFTYFGKRFDCVETSRGCTFPCTFCSIRSMYGATFRERNIEDVVNEVVRLKAEGVEGIFFVDDNIVLNLGRFKRLCAALAAAGTGSMECIVQASVPSIARDPEVAALMAAAGMRLVFLGIENGSERNLRLYRKKEINRDAEKAVRNLHAHGIIAVGGIIVGNPDDDAADVRAAFQHARHLGLDHAVVLCLQPYPGTELRKSLEEKGLITNPDDFSRYNGFIANVRTRHLTDRKLARLIGLESLKLNLSRQYLFNSRLVARYKPFFPQLMRNTIESFTGAWRNRMFETTSRF